MSASPFMICTGAVSHIGGDENLGLIRQTRTLPILCSGSDRETARGRALTLLEQAYPFAEGWTGHYVTDALVPMVDMLGEGTPIMIQRVRLTEPQIDVEAEDGTGGDVP